MVAAAPTQLALEVAEGPMETELGSPGTPVRMDYTIRGWAIPVLQVAAMTDPTTEAETEDLAQLQPSIALAAALEHVMVAAGL